MKLISAALIAFSAACATDTFKAQQETWQFDASKSDWSNKPGGAPPEATIAIADNGWTYTSPTRQGRKPISALTSKPIPLPATTS